MIVNIFQIDNVICSPIEAQKINANIDSLSEMRAEGYVTSYSLYRFTELFNKGQIGYLNPSDVLILFSEF